MKRKRKLDSGMEGFITPRFEKELENEGFKILNKKEDGWDILATKKYKQKYSQRKYYFEVKGKASKKSMRKDQHMEVAITRGIGQLVIKLKKATKWYKHFVLVVPESFENRLRTKLKNSYGFYLITKSTPTHMWFVNDYGKIIKKCQAKSFYKGHS